MEGMVKKVVVLLLATECYALGNAYSAGATRRKAIRSGAAAASLSSGRGLFGSLFGSNPASAAPLRPPKGGKPGPTNEILGVKDGIRQKRLGSGGMKEACISSRVIGRYAHCSCLHTFA